MASCLISTLCARLQADAELMAREIWVAKEDYEEAKNIRVPLSEYVYIHLSRQVHTFNTCSNLLGTSAVVCADTSAVLQGECVD